MFLPHDRLFTLTTLVPSQIGCRSCPRWHSRNRPKQKQLDRSQTHLSHLTSNKQTDSRFQIPALSDRIIPLASHLHSNPQNISATLSNPSSKCLIAQSCQSHPRTLQPQARLVLQATRVNPLEASLRPLRDPGPTAAVLKMARVNPLKASLRPPCLQPP